MLAARWVVALASAVAFVVGMTSFAAVRSSYYAKYGSYTGGRPSFFQAAFADDKAGITRAIAGLIAGFAGLLAFGLLSR